MKQSSLLFAILVLCFVLLQGCTGNETNTMEIRYIVVVISVFWNGGGYPSAIINYKDGTPFSPNEFCVWTFLAEDTTGEVPLQFSDNIVGTDDGIVVYTWKDSNFSSHKIPHGESQLTVNAQQIFVIFSSDALSESNGFNYYIYVQKAGEGITNPKHYFSGHNKGEYSYPQIIGQDKYKSDKRVGVVLQGATETPRPRQPREYNLRDLDTVENSDFVEIFILWPYLYNSNYNFVGRFSGQDSGAVANTDVITPFPVLYLFSSGRNGTGKGFTVTWKLFGNGVADTGDFMAQN